MISSAPCFWKAEHDSTIIPFLVLRYAVSFRHLFRETFLIRFCFFYKYLWSSRTDDSKLEKFNKDSRRWRWHLPSLMNCSFLSIFWKKSSILQRYACISEITASIFMQIFDRFIEICLHLQKNTETCFLLRKRLVN